MPLADLMQRMVEIQDVLPFVIATPTENYRFDESKRV